MYKLHKRKDPPKSLENKHTVSSLFLQPKPGFSEREREAVCVRDKKRTKRRLPSIIPKLLKSCYLLSLSQFPLFKTSKQNQNIISCPWALSDLGISISLKLVILIQTRFGFSTVMGNASVKEQKGQDECFMECGHAQAQVSSSSYHAHVASQIMHIQRDEYVNHIPAVIRWIHGGTNVAIEGSWDNWRTRELLEGSGNDFSIIKVLNVGVYHYRFVVDGRWTYASDLPHEHDHLGNVFNILDLKESYAENEGRDEDPECPSSPISSYNNAMFTLQDFGEKLPELPPLLQQMPLNQPSSSKSFQQALHKPLSANLNHLYVKRDGNNQPVVALSSSQRFRTKYVTSVLYKPFKKLRK